MTQPTFGIFQALEYGEVSEESLDLHNNEEYGYDCEENFITLEAFEALVAEYKEVDSDLTYQGGDPTDTLVIQHVPTKTFWKGEHFHDSWGGSGNFGEAYTDRPYQVVEKEVTVTQWVEVDEA